MHESSVNDASGKGSGQNPEPRKPRRPARSKNATGKTSPDKRKYPKKGHTPTNTGSKKPNFALRRILVLALLALLIWGIYAAVKEAGQWYQNQKVEAAALQEALSERTYPAPMPCEAKNLAYGLENLNLTPVQGQGINPNIVMRNQGKVPCLVQAKAKLLGIEITSGNQIIWNSTTCASDQGHQLLLGPGDEWKTPMPWNGRIAGENCQVQANLALPGTYRVAIWKDGKAVSEQSVFVIQADTPVPGKNNAD